MNYRTVFQEWKTGREGARLGRQFQRDAAATGCNGQPMVVSRWADTHSPRTKITVFDDSWRCRQKQSCSCVGVYTRIFWKNMPLLVFAVFNKPEGYSTFVDNLTARTSCICIVTAIWFVHYRLRQRLWASSSFVDGK
jgi:hypothetical protein